MPTIGLRQYRSILYLANHEQFKNIPHNRKEIEHVDFAEDII